VLRSAARHQVRLPVPGVVRDVVEAAQEVIGVFADRVVGTPGREVLASIAADGGVFSGSLTLQLRWIPQSSSEDKSGPMLGFSLLLQG